MKGVLELGCTKCEYSKHCSVHTNKRSCRYFRFCVFCHDLFLKHVPLVSWPGVGHILELTLLSEGVSLEDISDHVLGNQGRSPNGEMKLTCLGCCGSTGQAWQGAEPEPVPAS